MSGDSPYTLKKEAAQLIFATPSFKADKGSVLHKGIYNYEFASMLSAMLICSSVYVVIAFNSEAGVIHYMILVFLFILLFAALRKFVFRERLLELILDRDTETASIITPGLLSAKKENIPMAEIDAVEVGSVTIFPEDRDAAKFVEKISRQHGSVVPGLAEEAEFVTLTLKLKDGTERMIYAVKIEAGIGGEPDVPLEEIRNFLLIRE